MRVCLFTLAAVVLTGATAWAGDDPAKQNSQKDGKDAQTICGVVSAVSVEGETFFDFRSKSAVSLEASFLTVVGSPKDSSSDKAKAKDGDKANNSSGNDRDNVYIAWLSPKTKVFECSDADHPDKKTESSLGKLEIGDKVEMVFAMRDRTSANESQHQTEAMSKKHGRHRMMIGDANEIRVMRCKDNSAKGTSASK